MPKYSPEIVIPALSVSKENRKPVYKQVYESLQTLILKGQLRPKQRLPSSRSLAEQLGVSRNIILLAFEQLNLEGYITSGVGSGSFVADNIEEIFSAPEIKKKKSDSLGKNKESTKNVSFNYPLAENFIKRESSKGNLIPFGNPLPALDEFPYISWVKCAYKVFRGFEFLHLGYDDPQGYYPLREAIAGYLRTNRALQCEPEQIVIINGAQQGLNLIASQLLKKNDQFWMEDPGYGNAKAAFMQSGAKPCFIPLTKNGINIDWAIKHYPKAIAAYVTPSHQFPLGGTLSVSNRIRLLNRAAKKNMWIIEDDYDSEFRYSKKAIPSLQGLDQNGRVIYIGTFSKVLFPALRIGYLVLPGKEIAKTFVRAKAFSDRQNSITDQAIVYEFIKEGYFATHLRRMRLLYKKRQDLLLEFTRKYGKGIIRVEKQNSGMHVIAWLDKKINEQEISLYLDNAKVKVTPLSLYAARYKSKPGLILGYTAFNEKKLKEYTLLLTDSIRRFMLSRRIK